MPMSVVNIIEYLALIVSEFASYKNISNSLHQARSALLQAVFGTMLCEMIFISL